MVGGCMGLFFLPAQVVNQVLLPLPWPLALVLGDIGRPPTLIIALLPNLTIEFRYEEAFSLPTERSGAA